MIGVDEHTAVLDTSTPQRGTAKLYKKRRGALPAPPPLQPCRAGLDDPPLSMLASLPLALMTINRRGRVDFANEAAATLFGFAPASLPGTGVDALLPALAMDAMPYTPANITAKLAAPCTASAGDTLARRRDGTEFPAIVTARELSNHAESAILVTIVDRTDQYELTNNRKALAHLTRVSTLGQLAGSLAHELNQPLTAILANAQAAQRLMNAPPMYPEEMREILDDLIKDNHRASEVLRKIRLLVRQGEPEIEPLTVASLVDDVALLVHSDAIVRGMRMALDIPPDLPLIAGDKIQLQQVVLNLILNAFEAMSARPPPDRLVTIQAQLDKVNMIRLAVRDRGCGFPAKTLATLFTPYVSSKREGLGLGLCISRSIVEMHGGKLWAEQNSDRGATIYFTVPTVSVTNLRT